MLGGRGVNELASAWRVARSRGENKALLAVVRGCSWSQSIVKEITGYARRSLSGSLSDASSILAASTKKPPSGGFFFGGGEIGVSFRDLSRSETSDSPARMCVSGAVCEHALRRVALRRGECGQSVGPLGLGKRAVVTWGGMG